MTQLKAKVTKTTPWCKAGDYVTILDFKTEMEVMAGGQQYQCVIAVVVHPTGELNTINIEHLEVQL